MFEDPEDDDCGYNPEEAVPLDHILEDPTADVPEEDLEIDVETMRRLGTQGKKFPWVPTEAVGEQDPIEVMQETFRRVRDAICLPVLLRVRLRVQEACRSSGSHPPALQAVWPSPEKGLIWSPAVGTLGLGMQLIFRGLVLGQCQVSGYRLAEGRPTPPVRALCVPFKDPKYVVTGACWTLRPWVLNRLHPEQVSEFVWLQNVEKWAHR